MTAAADKFKSNPLIIKLHEARTLHGEFKDLLHKNGISHQKLIPGKREISSQACVYTAAINYVNKTLAKQAKASKDKTTKPLRVCKISPAMSKFLKLQDRGLEPGYYFDTGITSYFSNYVVADARKKSSNVVELRDPAVDELIILFGDELSKVGSGPTINGVKTAVLDKDRKQINKFMDKMHMVVFKDQYEKKVGANGVQKRHGIPREDNPKIYEALEKERRVLKEEIKPARRDYVNAQAELQKAKDKMERGISLGDSSIRMKVLNLENQVKDTRNKFIRLLNLHGFAYNPAL